MLAALDNVLTAFDDRLATFNDVLATVHESIDHLAVVVAVENFSAIDTGVRMRTAAAT